MATYKIEISESLLADIKIEIGGALLNYGHFNSTHEAYAVLQEEVNEFWALVQSKTSDINREGKRVRMIKELTQVAAISMRIIMELKENKIKHT